MEEDPIPALQRAESLGLLRAIQPGLTARPLTSFDNTAPHPPLVYLGGLACSMSQQPADALIARLNMPNEWASVVRDTITIMKSLDALDSEDCNPSNVVELLNARHPLEAVRHACGRQRTAAHISRYLSEWRHTAPQLNGVDLQRLGIPPGPDTGRILKELGRARLDGLVSSQEEEIALVRGMMEGVSGAA